MSSRKTQMLLLEKNILLKIACFGRDSEIDIMSKAKPMDDGIQIIALQEHSAYHMT